MDLSDELRFDYLDKTFQLGYLHSLYTGILAKEPWAVLDYYKMGEIQEYQPVLKRFHELYPSVKEPSLDMLVEEVRIPKTIYVLE